jgi:diacylglycerol kinase
VKLIKPFLFAFNGIKICLSSEINFIIHVVAAIAAAAAGIWLHISRQELLAIKKIPGLNNRASLIN